MSLRATILGCGSSGGVPRVGGEWGYCDPDETRNRRSRCSLLLEKTGSEGCTSILIDTSPDLRDQLLTARVTRLDAVFFTHDHADQTHGIDDLRAIVYGMRRRMPTYMDAHTKTHIGARFDYCFKMPEGRVHPAILDLQPLLKDGDMITIEGPGGPMTIEVIEASHGPTPVLMFVIDGKLAYSPDVWDIPKAGLNRLQGIDTWICDSLRYNDHPTHAHVDKSLRWFAHTQTRRAILTNLHIDLDYATLRDELPYIATPAHDGMIIDIST